MNRFFCKDSDIREDEIIISDKEDAHHIKNVLRLKKGWKIEVSDESGNIYACEISGVGDLIRLVIKNRTSPAGKSRGVELAMAVAIPKKSKIDDIIDKLVQLGVNKIIPLATERVIVKLDKAKQASRFLRWKRIALCAAKQCKRSDLTVIEPVKSFRDLVAHSSGFDLKLIPYLGGKRQKLKDLLDKFFGDNPVANGPENRIYPKILVLIGPEGDFSGEEVNLALSAGFIPVTLGSLVLRVDTAAISVASFIRLYADH